MGIPDPDLIERMRSVRKRVLATVGGVEGLRRLSEAYRKAKDAANVGASLGLSRQTERDQSGENGQVGNPDVSDQEPEREESFSVKEISLKEFGMILNAHRNAQHHRDTYVKLAKEVEDEYPGILTPPSEKAKNHRQKYRVAKSKWDILVKERATSGVVLPQKITFT